MKRKLLFVVNVDWFFLSHRLPIAQAALSKGYEVHIATGVTNRLDELLAYSLVMHPLDLKRSGSGLFSAWKTLGQIIRVMRQVRPDIVHLVTIKPVLLGGLATRWVGVPAMVAAVPGLGFAFLARGMGARIRRILIGWLYRVALRHQNARVIFQNPDDLAHILQLARLPENKTALIFGSGVDLDKFTMQPFAPGAPVVMLPARMLVDKGGVNSWQRHEKQKAAKRLPALRRALSWSVRRIQKARSV